MSFSATVDAMVKAGCSVEQIAAVVRSHEAASEAKLEAKRAKDAERKRRGRVPEKQWLKLTYMVLSQRGHICAYCGATDRKLSIDHVVPVARGGSNDLFNLVPACTPCNSSKRDRLLSEWKGHRQ